MQDESNSPAWRKRMEHGSLGEARARAFLMERFWVLDRSVDIDGADLIVQLRVTDKNILDREPPKFGVIQVKFGGSRNVTHYIPQAYLCNSEGETSGEFFVLIYTGHEDDERSFILSSKDIASNFEVTSDDHSRPGQYAIPMSWLMDTQQFDITSKRSSLDRIENAISLADFARNRKYIANSIPSFVRISPDHIDSDYLIDIENWYCNFRDALFDIKKSAQRIVNDMDEIAEKLRGILRSSDPVEVSGLIEDLKIDVDWQNKAYFSFHNICDDEFVEAVYRHRDLLAKLRSHGLEGSYLSLQYAFENWLASDLVGRLPLSKALTYCVEARFDRSSLRVPSFSSSIKENVDDISEKWSIDEAIGDGYIRISYCSSHFRLASDRHSEKRRKTEAAEYASYMQNILRHLRRYLMEAITKHCINALP